MKCLFVSLYRDSPHFETELEIIADLLAEGHDVRVLRCTGQLASCLVNPDGLRSICSDCVSRIDDGLDAIRHPRLTVEVIAPGPLDPRLPRMFESMEALKTYSLDGVNIGRGACASTCGWVNKDTKLDTREHAELIWRQLAAAWQTYDVVSRALDRERPDRVYVFNGRFATCYPVVLACRARGIDFFTHDRGASAEHYLVRKNHLPHDLDVINEEVLATWATTEGDDKERIASAWYEGRRRGAELTTTSFTKSQTVGLLPDGFDRGRRNIAIFNSTIEEYDAIEQDVLLYEDEVIGLRRIVESLQGQPNLHLYLRVHPNLRGIPHQQNYQLRVYEELGAAFDHLTVIWPESLVHTYSLMEACELTLTFGSTMGAESAFWGKPSVLAGRAAYERTGCAYVPRTHEELIGLLTTPLEPKGRASAYPYAYWESTKGTRYHRFQPSGLLYGTFEGKKIRPSYTARARSIALRLLGR